MKKMFKHKLLAVSALAVALFTGYSCQDDDNYPMPANAGFTSLEVMKNDQDFANFLAVVDKCGEGCLDSLFNQSRVYTIWAPVIDDEKKESLIASIEEGNREDVFQQFVKFHIANYLHPANGELEATNKLLMMNNKYAVFTGNTTDGYTFGDCNLIEPNIRTKNGIIHKIAAPVKYSPSIWESLRSIASVKSFWDFCESFTVKEIDRINSIPGPIVNQQQTYLDTAYNEKNEITNGSNLGPIDNEDSLFITFVPTSEAWNRVYNEAPNFFRYDTENFTDEQKIEADSLSLVRGAKEYLRYLTYSITDQKVEEGKASLDNLPDSLIAYHRETPRKKFPMTLFANPVETINMSNGQLRVLDYMPFSPCDLWFDTIFVQADNFGLVRVDENEITQQRGLFETIFVDEKKRNPAYDDDLAYDAYLQARPDGSTMPWRTYFFKNVLSAKYKVAFVTVPEDFMTIPKEDEENTKPVKVNASSLRVSVNYRGEQLYANPATPVKVSGQDAYYNTIRPSIAKVDTIFLTNVDTGEPFVFDLGYCEDYSGISTREFKDKDYTFEVKIETAKPATRKIQAGRPVISIDNAYAQSFQIDQIMLIPVVEDETIDEE